MKSLLIAVEPVICIIFFIISSTGEIFKMLRCFVIFCVCTLKPDTFGVCYTFNLQIFFFFLPEE